MKRNIIVYINSAILFFIFSANAYAEQVLGHFPLCEASAAASIICPGTTENCILVADNEQRNSLFLFSIEKNKLNSASQKTLNLQLSRDQELSDIEALTLISPNNILALGSHSRNTKCQAKKKRRQFAKIQLSANGASVIQKIHSKKIKCGRLFGKINPKNKALKAVCETIDNAEQHAIKLEKQLEGRTLTARQEADAKKRCNEILPYNAEGVVAIPGKKKNTVWVGLRAPLLAKHPENPKHKNLAILLQMKNLTSYAFNNVALLNLDGRGIRELTYTKDTVWVIAGPAQDKQEPFQLRRFAKSALKSGKVIHTELIKTLPTSSEGLAILGKTAFVVIDGDTGKDETAIKCKSPSKFIKVNYR